MSDILTAQELSTYLKITTTTIYKLAHQGEIPSFKIGSEWRFKKELVDRWLENGAGHAPRKVLIIDDEPALCELYKRALDRKKFLVDSVHSGKEGIQAACQNNYDFIFLDLRMPVMNGVEVFGELKKSGIRSLVVIVTAYPDSDLLSEAMKLGPLTVILKPFDLNEIQRAVESLVLMTSRA